jgi:hypothetical protein
VQRVRRVHFTPEIAFIFIALLIVTILFSIGGAFIISEASAQTDRLRNPPPQIVNPILPDSDSLTRGAAAYAQHCSACHGERGEGTASAPLSSHGCRAFALLSRRGAMKRSSTRCNAASALCLPCHCLSKRLGTW